MDEKMKRRSNCPPVLLMRLVEKLVPVHDRESFPGDMGEIYTFLINKKGQLWATIWYFFQLFKLLIAAINRCLIWSGMMFNNLIKIAWRHIVKNRGYSLITVSGLAVSLAVCLLIIGFVIHEMSYDRYVENAPLKFRVSSEVTFQGQSRRLGGSVAPLAPQLRSEFPEIANAIRLYIEFPLIQYQEKKFNERQFFFADPGVIQMFSLKMIHGNEGNALKAPYSMVFTNSMAKKYFGDGNPVGKVVILNGKEPYTVTAVVADPPTNSYFQFNFLASFSTLYSNPPPGPPLNFWIGYNYETFIELKEDTNLDDFQNKLPDFYARHSRESNERFGASSEIFLQPLLDLHLHSNLDWDKDQGQRGHLVIFSAIAFIILFIASINFINLATAQASMRGREVGIRKVMGAGRNQLILQFLGENIMLSVFAMSLSLGLVTLLQPVFNEWVQIPLEFNPLKNGALLFSIIGLAFLTGIGGGLYPAWVLSAFRPVVTLKSGLMQGRRGRRARTVLVVLQFTLSVILIAGSFTVLKQIDYMRSADLGFDQSQVAVIPLSGQTNSDRILFNQHIQALSGIEAASLTSTFPGRGNISTEFTFEGKEGEVSQEIPYIDTDWRFLNTMDMKLMSGRPFRQEDFEKNVILVNEFMVKEAGWEQPLNQTVEMLQIVHDQPVKVPHQVIGVVKDFHLNSLHHAMSACILRPSNQYSFLLVRMTTASTQETIEQIQSIWDEMTPQQPFRHVFLDEYFDRQYGQEIRVSQLIAFFAVLAIVLAGMGLTGLASCVTQQKTKEIGIRKVVGASTGSIARLMLSGFLKWIVIANIIGGPLVFWGVTGWLQQFAYRIHPGWDIFTLTAFGTLLIGFVTVLVQTLKAALTNPVTSLQYE